MEAAGQQTVADEFRGLSVDLLEASIKAFFADHGVSVALDSAEVETERRIALPLGAMIGFVSDHARGTLALAIEPALASASHPTDGQDDESLSDWAAETANQVLGRLKNQLLPFGITLLGDNPMTVSGHARIGARHRPAVRLGFESSEGALRVWWDVQVDDDMVIGRGGEQATAEGEVVLF
ncbi:MAG: hypothetical protein OXU20_13020 [Myxococcales bacterium]|nr:hypothetical protein [Myxococcales bacterium]MDD9968813.1 hypothetical protein [Myxococcales bacterium]